MPDIRKTSPDDEPSVGPAVGDLDNRFGQQFSRRPAVDDAVEFDGFVAMGTALWGSFSREIHRIPGADFTGGVGGFDPELSLDEGHALDVFVVVKRYDLGRRGLSVYFRTAN
jgi:hypothetical protein